MWTRDKGPFEVSYLIAQLPLKLLEKVLFFTALQKNIACNFFIVNQI